MGKVLLLFIFLVGWGFIFANEQTQKSDENITSKEQRVKKETIKVKHIDNKEIEEKIKDYNNTFGGEG